MMKLCLYIICLLLFISCKSHIFYKITLKRYNSLNKYYSLKARDINLSNYVGFYCVIYRKTNHKENIYNNKKNEKTDDNNLHIADIQYILLDTIKNQFIHLSYMPRKYSKYYLDKNDSTYHELIDLYNLNLLFIGKVCNDTLMYRFKEESKNRDVKYLVINDTLQLINLYYHKNKLLIDLKNTLDINHLHFQRMDKFSICLLKSRNSIVHFNNEVTILSSEKKNLIFFQFKNIYENQYTYIYFKTKNGRFDFQFP